MEGVYVGLATWSQTSNSVIQGFGFFSLWPTAGRILVAAGGGIRCSGVGLLPDSEQTQAGSAGVGRRPLAGHGIGSGVGQLQWADSLQRVGGGGGDGGGGPCPCTGGSVWVCTTSVEAGWMWG